MKVHISSSTPEASTWMRVTYWKYIILLDAMLKIEHGIW